MLCTVCKDIGSVYGLLLPVLNAMITDALPASVFSDVIRLVRSKRSPCLEPIASSIASPVLLVSALCIHTRKLPVWRAGACLIDSMSRLGYG